MGVNRRFWARQTRKSITGGVKLRILVAGFWLALLFVPKFLYGATGSFGLAVGLSIAVVSGVNITLYQYLRRGFERRKRMAERAKPVPCSVENTHIGSTGSQGGMYFPLVEFTYRHDGFEKRSLHSHPDGVYKFFANVNDALAAAERLASEAGDAAYYDPETGRAFLRDEAYPGPIRKYILLSGVSSAVNLLLGVAFHLSTTY